MSSIDRHAVYLCPNHNPLRARLAALRGHPFGEPHCTMPIDNGEGPHDTAVEQLERFGLSSYAAQTYVALVSLGTGSAKDVSRVSEVPRTRVYDAAEELRENDLADVQQTNPKRFTPVSAETTGRKFEREMQRRTALLTDALDALEPKQPREEQQGVWTVSGRQAVTDRVVEFFEAAEEEIVYMTVDDVLTEDVLVSLRDAADRGVTVRLAGMSPAVQEAIGDEIPEAETFESLWLWSDTPAGRLLLIDRERTLASVLVENEARSSENARTETAIWGVGETNSLVVVLEAIFAWRLDSLDDS